MKKILILGGTYFQVPAIQYAKKRGYHVITCDYLPNNPGHKLADEYYNVSTTDKEAVLELSKELNINGILCFASDPAAPTAAYVAEELNLPGNSYEKIAILGQKHHWRRFLAQHGFNTPKADFFSSYNEFDDKDWHYPLMVKPVDSSGSKGVIKISENKQLKEAFDYALSFSRIKKVIVEEFVERVGPQIGGDGFFGVDRLDFVCFGDQIVDSQVNPYVPCGMTFPSYISEQIALKIRFEIEAIIKAIGLKNLSFNLEVMIDKDENIYVMELGPRNGGNCIPEVIHAHTQVDLVGLAVEAAMGNPLDIYPQKSNKVHAYYALHSDKKGLFKGFVLKDGFKDSVFRQYIMIEKDVEIDVFNGSNQTIGILLLEFDSKEKMNCFFNSPASFVEVIVN